MADKDAPSVGALESGVVETTDDISKLAGLLGGEEQDSTDDSPASDDDAPDERRASGEDKDRDEQDDSPAIEAPASWDAEAKKRFAKLDPETQQFLIAREADREKGVNSKLQEAAESRKKADAAAEQVGQLRSAYEQRLVAFAKQLEGSIPEEFKAIKTPADLYAVSQKDPALAARFTAFQQQAASVMNELAQIEAHKQNEAQAKFADFVTKERTALAEKWPDFVDEKKGPAIRAELTEHAKSLGFSDQEIAGAADHRMMLLLRDAVEGRKAIKALEKAKAKADKAPAARVAKPGQGEASARNGADRASLMTALRSGNTDKQVAAMQRILNG